MALGLKVTVTERLPVVALMAPVPVLMTEKLQAPVSTWPTTPTFSGWEAETVNVWLGLAVPVCQLKMSDAGSTVTGGVGETVRVRGTTMAALCPAGDGVMVTVPL